MLEGYHKQPFMPSDEKQSGKICHENYFMDYQDLIKTVYEFRLACEKDLKEYKVTFNAAVLTVNVRRKQEAAKLATCRLSLKSKGLLR